MGYFYDGLGRGASVGEALREAKRRLASSPESAAPFFWAGVILIGEPDLRLDLRPARSTSPIRWIALAMLLALATGLALVGFRGFSRKRRVTQTPLERQTS